MIKKISAISAAAFVVSACTGGAGTSSSSDATAVSSLAMSSLAVSSLQSSADVSSASISSEVTVSSQTVSSSTTSLPTAVSSSSEVSSSSVISSSSTISSSSVVSSSMAATSSISPPPASSSSRPATGLSAFEDTIRPLLVENQCVICHGDSAGVYQSPMFAHSDPLYGEYELISAGKVNFDRPDESRIVEKIGGAPLHNCGSTLEECQALASEFSEAIAQWSLTQGSTGANATSPLQSNTQTLANKTLKPLAGERQGKPIAAYDFVDCEDNLIKDISGMEPPINLLNETNAKCVLSLGLIVPTGSYAEATPEASRRVYTAVKASEELSIEAWVKVQTRTNRGPYGAIIAYAPDKTTDVLNSGYDPTPNNFHLSNWTGQNFIISEIFKQRIQNFNGYSAHTGLRVASPKYNKQFVHVVAVYEGTQIRIYQDGVLSGEREITHPAGTGWRDDFHIILGKAFYQYLVDDELMQFGGIIGYAAIHDKALTPEQVATNATIPSGRKNVLRFDVATLTEQPGTYVEVGVRALGTRGYAFFEPTLYGPNIEGLAIKGLTITVNGRINTLGQSFASIDKTVDALNAEGGFVLSTQGTTIVMDQGAELDQFALAFDQIGDKVFERASVNIPTLRYRDDGKVSRVSGVKISDHIHNTFSTAVGLTKDNPAIAAAFTTVKDSLPVSTNIASTKATHQIIIANMAYKYCAAMVADAAANGEFFTQFNLDGDTGGANIDALLSDVFAKAIKPNTTKTSREDFDSAMMPLIEQLTSTNTPLSNIAVSVCGSSLASAAATTY